MADAGVTIGRVSVRVYPDTSNFRRDLKRQLEQIENRLKLTVDAVLNTKMLEKHADAVVTRMNRTSERRKRRIYFEAALDTDGLLVHTRAVSETLDRYLRDKQIKILAELDDESRKKVKKELDDLIEDYDGDSVDLEAKVNSIVARAELARVSRDRVVTMFVNVSKASVARAEATLAALAGVRLLSSTLRNIWDLFKNLDKNIPLIGTIAEAVMGLGAGLLAALSNTFALSKALAQIGGLVFALPGMAGGFAFGIGAAVAVLKDFNAVIPEVGQRLSRLQDSMSDAFWGIAEGPIRRVVDDLFPQFEGGLIKTSRALGVWFGGLAAELNGALDGSLHPMFSNLATSIAIAASANGALATSIEVLGRRGAEYLPRLAGWYKRVAEGFADWLVEADRTGRLNDYIDTAITQLGHLGGVLRETGRIFWGIAEAADEAGGSSLAQLHDTLRKVADVVNREPFRSNLVDVLTAAHDAMSLIARESGPAVKRFFTDFPKVIAPAMRTAGEGIGDLVRGIFEALNTDGFAYGFLDFLDGIREGISALDGIWKPLGDALGAIGTLAGTLAREFGPLLGELITSLSRAAVDILPSLTPAIESLADTVGDILEVTLPAVTGLAEGLVALGTSALGSGPALAGVVLALGGLKLALASKSLVETITGLTTFFGRAPDAERMGKAINGISKSLIAIAAVATGVGLVADGLSKMNVNAPDSSKLVKSFDALAAGATTIEEIDKLFAGREPNWFQKTFLAPFADSAFSANQIDGLADAFERLEKSTGGFWDKVESGKSFTGWSWLNTPAFNQAAEDVEGLDKALADLVLSGNEEALGAALDYVNLKLSEKGQSLQDVTEHLPQYKEALESQAIAEELAAQRSAQAAAAQQAAFAQYEDAINRVNGLTPSLLQSINDTSKEFINLSTGLDEEALPSVDAWLTKLEEQATAMSEWADNLVAIKERGVSDAVIQELARLGEEGAPMVAQLVDASDEEFSRLEEIVRLKTEGAAGAVGSAFAQMSEDVAAELSKLSPEAQQYLEDMGITLNIGAGGAVGQLVDGLNAGQPAVGEAGAAAALRYKEGVLDQLTAVQGVGASLAAAAVSGAGAAGGALAGVGAVAGGSFATGISGTAGEAQGAGREVAGSVPVALDGMTALLLHTQGLAAGNSFANGISTSAIFVMTAAAGLAQVVDVPGAGSLLFSDGLAAGQGFANGISAKQGAVRAAASRLAGIAKSAIQSALDIHSPSRVTREMGGYVVDGLVVGIEERMSHLRRAMNRVADVVSSTDVQSPFEGRIDTAVPVASAPYGTIADSPVPVGAPSGDVNIQVSVTKPGATAEEIAQAIAHEVRGISRGGRYAG
ncbi:hypothetical protein [Puerhibacterium puerhi]|uniref:hypothetical protein n=1 Tax=Puerhibacterium puerhi TaxID=2692623 RepID=UPI0013591BB6|nr:hypothetical protein [Puerhibacterium puerhi]